MKQDVLKQAATFSKEHRRKVRRHRVVSALAAIVVFCTTYVLIMPAITLENDTAPICGLEEHAHTEACYGELELVCGLDESAPDAAPEGHVHGEGCYVMELEEQQVLDCALPEDGGHAHSETCWEEQFVTTGGELVCADESEEHEHTEACYAPVEEHTEQVLVCGLEEHAAHEHTQECYHTESVEVGRLICEMEEAIPMEEHAHSEECYAPALVCGLDEHAHDEACWPEEEFTETSAPEGALPEMALLPEGAQVPEGYDVEYTSIGDGFAVTVYAPEGALPEGAVLAASLLAQDSAEYQSAEEALDRDSYDGMVAMDIRFEMEGHEIEPAESVYVVINALGLLPADADPMSVAIQHLEEDMDSGLVMPLVLEDEDEDEDASGVNVVVVADSTEETGLVEVEDTDVVAAFEVESFSYFTITYSTNANIPELKVYLVDGSGNDIGSKDVQLNKSHNITSETEIDTIIKDPAIDLATYSYNGKVYSYTGVYNARTGGTEVQKIRYDNKSWQYQNGNKWNSIQDNSLYLRYDEAGEQLAFYYVVDPAKATTFDVQADAMEGSWFYFGHGNIFRNENKGTGKRYAYDSTQVKGDLVYPKTIQVQGNTYYYEGLPESKKEELYRENVTLFYDVVWVRFVDENTSRHDQDEKYNLALNPEDGYNNTKNCVDLKPDMYGTVKNIWHVDGYLVLRPKVQVKYYILDENGQGAQLPNLGTGGFYAGSMLNKNDCAEQKRYGPVNDTGLYGTVEFDDWYTDPGCTEMWDFADPVTEDLTLYHRLEIKRPQNYNLSIGKVAGVVADGMEEDIKDSDTPLSGLPGATFEIYEVGDEEKVLITELSPNKLSGQGGPATAATGDKGVLLEFGKIYELVETVAPAGYNALSEPIYFKAESNAEDNKFVTTLTLCDRAGTAKDYTNAMVDADTLTLIVANYGGFRLPNTGGPGVYQYALGGMLLMAAAAILMYKTSRRREGGRTA